MPLTCNRKGTPMKPPFLVVLILSALVIVSAQQAACGAVPADVRDFIDKLPAPLNSLPPRNFSSLPDNTWRGHGGVRS
jgi:hypothetical protein